MLHNFYCANLSAQFALSCTSRSSGLCWKFGHISATLVYHVTDKRMEAHSPSLRIVVWLSHLRQGTLRMSIKRLREFNQFCMSYLSVKALSAWKGFLKIIQNIETSIFWIELGSPWTKGDLFYLESWTIEKNCSHWWKLSIFPTNQIFPCYRMLFLLIHHTFNSLFKILHIMW